MMFELLAPYGELRLHSAVPSDEVAFYLRHGETEESLKVKSVVHLVIIRVCSPQPFDTISELFPPV